MGDKMRIDGADISHHQGGELDYDRATQAGLRFLYHKATEGATFVDKNYDKRRRQAKKAGVPFGAYHFAHPEQGDAREEADFFLEVASPQSGDLLPALDIEVNPQGMSKSELTEWVGNFVQRVRKVTGVHPVIYTPFNLLNNFGCMLWTARYSNGNAYPRPEEPWKRWDIWQFSDGVYGTPHTLPGFGGVDLNTLNDHVSLRDLLIPEPEPERSKVLRITTQNVKALPLMPQPDVVEDVQLTAKQSQVIFWQEIGPDRYDRAVHDLEELGCWETWWGQGRVREDKAVERGDDQEKPGYETPISWRSDVWEFVEGGVWKLHDAEAKICNNRWTTWVVLKHIDTDAEVYFDNSHYVSAAWSPNPHYAQDRRKEMWRDGYAKHVAWLQKQIEEHPHRLLCLGGDYNAQLKRDGHLFREKISGRKVVSGVGERSIDHLFFINGRSWTWDLLRRELMPGRNSDHQGRRARVALEEK